MGMHNSRKLQLEQATLVNGVFMVYLMVCEWICLVSSFQLKPKKQSNLRVYLVQAKNHQKPVVGLT
jgi:hypothetical protein